jgi:hypothetical protein
MQSIGSWVYISWHVGDFDSVSTKKIHRTMKSFVFLAAVLGFLASTTQASVIHLSENRKDASQAIAAPIAARQGPPPTTPPSPTPITSATSLETNPTEASPAPTDANVPSPSATAKPSTGSSNSDKIIIGAGIVGVLIPFLYWLYKRFRATQYEPISLLNPTDFELTECWRVKEESKAEEARNYAPTDEELLRNWNRGGQLFRKNEEYRLRKRKEKHGAIGALAGWVFR